MPCLIGSISTFLTVYNILFHVFYWISSINVFWRQIGLFFASFFMLAASGPVVSRLVDSWQVNGMYGVSSTYFRNHIIITTIKYTFQYYTFKSNYGRYGDTNILQIYYHHVHGTNNLIGFGNVFALTDQS